MDNYSTEESLKATFSDNEVSGLLLEAPGIIDAVRLDKAASLATAEINAIMATAGYVVPLVLVDYATDYDPPVEPQLLAISDHFTAWHLASSTDLSKKKYDDLRAADLALLDKVKSGEVQLPYMKTTTPTGHAQVVTLSRPRVFTLCMQSQDAPFGKNYR